MSQINLSSVNTSPQEVSARAIDNDLPDPSSLAELGITSTLVEVFSVGDYHFGSLPEAVVQARLEQTMREGEDSPGFVTIASDGSFPLPIRRGVR